MYASMLSVHVCVCGQRVCMCQHWVRVCVYVPVPVTVCMRVSVLGVCVDGWLWAQCCVCVLMSGLCLSALNSCAPEYVRVSLLPHPTHTIHLKAGGQEGLSLTPSLAPASAQPLPPPQPLPDWHPS